MKITLDGRSYSVLISALGEECAKIVHSHMISLHNAAVEREDKCRRNEAFITLTAEAMAEVRAAVTSIPCKSDRRIFVGLIKHYLDKKCAERGTHRRTTDYLAAVRKYRQSLQAA